MSLYTSATIANLPSIQTVISGYCSYLLKGHGKLITVLVLHLNWAFLVSDNYAPIIVKPHLPQVGPSMGRGRSPEGWGFVPSLGDP